jgi:hypothetical protein
MLGLLPSLDATATPSASTISAMPGATAERVSGVKDDLPTVAYGQPFPNVAHQKSVEGTPRSPTGLASCRGYLL